MFQLAQEEPFLLALNMNLKIKVLIILALFFSSCFPNEEGIEPRPRLNKSVEIDAGETRKDISFYSLENDSLMATANPQDWDLYFENESVKINYFRSMRVAPLDEAWQFKLDTAGLQFSYLTVNSENQWHIDLDRNYVVDYGFDDDYNHLGFYKLHITKLDKGYRIQYSPIESAYELEAIVELENGYYNILKKEILSIPLESEYDIAFGKYTDYVIFPDEEADYLVYGTLLGNASAVRLENKFEDVNATALDSIDFNSNQKSIIGWDWKSYNLDAGAYTVEENLTYIIKTNSGFVYKLRFVNFYNSKGISGHPTFEYALL